VAQLLKKNAACDADQMLLGSTSLVPARGNRRRFIRYPLRALALFQWEGQDGSRKHARGWTKDVSEAGAYVVSSRCPRVGEEIQMVLRFPVPAMQEPALAAKIDMNATVLRIDRDAPEGRELGFAVFAREHGPDSNSERFEDIRRDEEKAAIPRIQAN